MRITGIHASNFLSFAPDKEDGGPGGLHMKGLARPLTILVGPNGAGKSNVLHVVETLMDFLKNRHLDPEKRGELISLHHRKASCNRIVLAVDVLFDRPEERDLFVLFFRNLLVGPSSSMSSNVFSKGAQGARPMLPDRLALLQETLSNGLGEKDVELFFQGQFRLEVDIRNTYRYNLAFVCHDTKLPVTVGILHPYHAGMIRMPASPQELCSQSLRPPGKRLSGPLAQFVITRHCGISRVVSLLRKKGHSVCGFCPVLSCALFRGMSCVL